MHPLLAHGLAHADTSHVALDPEGRIIAIDAVGAGWLGATPEAVVGQGPWVFGGLIREQEWPATWARLVDERHLMVEGAIVGRGGQLFRLAVQLSYVPGGAERDAYVFGVAIRRAAVQAEAEDAGTVTRLNYASAFIDDPLMDCNLATGELTMNEAAARLTGLPPGGRFTLEDVVARLPGDERATAEPLVDALLSGRADRARYVRRLQVAGDEPRLVLVRLRVAARAPDGRALRLVAHGLDITEQEQATAEARAQRELFAAVAHTCTAAIVVLDPSGRIVFANARAEAVLGLERSRLLERAYDDPAWRPTAPDGGPWPDDAQPFVRVMRGRAPVRDVRHAIEWPDGARRQLRVNGEPVFDPDGSIRCVVFAVEDVTEEVAAAEKLARSEQRLRDVLDRLSVGVNLTGGDGRLLFWNRTSADVLQLDEGSTGACLLDRIWDTVDANGEAVPREAMPAAQALVRREAVHGVKLGFRRPEWDERRWFLVSSIPSFDARGQVADLVSQFIDISELRRLEVRLREARRLEAVGRLAGGVAHDFNNLLTTILTNADYLSSCLPRAHPMQRELGEIQRAGDRGAALVRSLLGYARRQFRMPRSVDATRLLRRTATRWQQRVGLPIDLAVMFDERMPALRVDPQQFEQVVEALLDNAFDAAGPRGRLQVELAGLELMGEDPRWPLLPAGLYACLAVSDDGPGVPEADVERIFEPFFTTRMVGERSGLGLANCHGIARQNGGDIRLAENGPGGATLEVMWPFRRPEGDAEPLDSVEQI